MAMKPHNMRSPSLCLRLVCQPPRCCEFCLVGLFLVFHSGAVPLASGLKSTCLPRWVTNAETSQACSSRLSSCWVHGGWGPPRPGPLHSALFVFKTRINSSLSLSFFKIYIFWLHQVLVAACGLLSCGTRAGSSSPTRDQTPAPCIGSVESYPLDHLGSPNSFYFILFYFIFLEV